MSRTRPLRLADGTPLVLTEPRIPQSFGFITFCTAALDARLGGGLAQAALHELFAAQPDDMAATAGLSLLLALRGRMDDDKPLIWVREQRNTRQYGCLYAPALIEMGIDPDDLFLVDTPDSLTTLRSAADIAACEAVGAVIIEPWGKAPKLDLTASRRLALAARQSGVPTIILRSGAEPTPSAAHSRWLVRSAPSTALEANAPGVPAFDITLLRHRGGIAGFSFRLEWDHDQKSFREPPLSGGVSTVPAFGTTQAQPHRAAA